ncbi:hypothetical protein CPB84DRAFT_1726269 [Gymnopilus junonius]|uniref:Smr domain-containing protein n=1 Tax=Gymnopilus junonius TaxID=109634 RepID=A0A9P5TQG1_GYMJU|nr:hypothetical protein CPB84DRAFT_1726269 [Gymnopilus junonius]
MSWVQFLKAVFAFFCGPQPEKVPEHPLPAQKPSARHDEGNEYYASLRAQANEHGDQMSKCFQQSHDAYARGDGALAKDLSNQGKDHQREMDQLNKQASDYIFAENNKDCKPGEVDLHGLYVKEAIARADEAIQIAKRKGQAQIHFIVGKGLHSQGGVAKIKPAIEALMRKYRLSAELDPHNSGVLIVNIESEAGEGGIGPEEISRRLEGEKESCVIM